MDDRLTLILASDPGAVSVARAFVASVLHVLEVEESRVDEVRLAVSELVTHLVRHGAGSELTFGLEDGRIDLVVRSSLSTGALPPIPRRVLAGISHAVEADGQSWTLHLDG